MPEWADAETFQIIDKSRRVAKDKNHVYIGGKIVEWADPATYETLGTARRITKDKNHVYIYWKISEWADPESFSTTDKHDVFYDKNNVYFTSKFLWRLQKIPGADVATFETLSLKDFYKDKDHVYHKGSVITWADPESFAKYLWSYYIDKDSVFYHQTELSWVDTNTFSHIGDGYFGDINNIIYGWKKISSHPEWFKVMDEFPKNISAQLKGNSVGCILEPLFGITTRRYITSYIDGNWDFFVEWINISNFNHNWNQILNFTYLADCYSSWSDTEADISFVVPLHIGFTPNREKKIDTTMQQTLTKKLPKRQLKKTLETLIDSTENYQYGSRRELITWAFYRYLLENLDTYYIQ